MIVISDTTAITNLYQIGRLQLLKDIFGKILIPPAVEQELSEVPGQLDFVSDMHFIETKKPADAKNVTHFKSSLDDGEAEAIALAIELQADYLIIDEWKGRRIAQQAGLIVIGLVGILLTAKRKGLLLEIKPILSVLTNQAGFRLHPALLNDALRDAGE